MIVIQHRRKDQAFDVPTGGIVLWYGLAAGIPVGWEIYLEAKDFYLMGATEAGVSLTPAGASTHTHTFPNVETKPDHTHTANTDVGGGGSGITVYSGGTNSAASGSHAHGSNGTVSPAGGHTHTLGDASPASTHPAYYRLYYIRRTA